MVVYCCSLCASALTPSTSSVKCEVCAKKYAHIKRLDTVSGASNTETSWTCNTCSTSDSPISLSAIEQIIKKQFNKLKTELKFELAQVISEKFQQISDRIQVVEDNVEKLQSELNLIKNKDDILCDM